VKLTSKDEFSILPNWNIFRGRTTTAFWMALVLIALIVLFSLVTPNHAFFQVSNFQSMGRDGAIGILLAVGMTFVLGAGHLDLSIGANLVLSSVLGAQAMAAFATSTNFAANLSMGLVVCRSGLESASSTDSS
jgi:ribose/xylose/arabinose/galactoside ABC-type transport system permease subunit